MAKQSFNHSVEDEISLRDVINFLIQSWRIISISGVAGGLFATAYTFTEHPNYHATAAIQVAKVLGADVEASDLLLEKIKLPTYYSVTSYSACGLMAEPEPGVVIVENVTANLSKNQQIVNISYKADSRDGAHKCLGGIVNDIRDNQNNLARSIFKVEENKLIKLKKKLDALENTQKTRFNKISELTSADSISSVVLFYLTNLSAEAEINNLWTKVNNLEISLAESEIKETFFIAPIHVSKEKIFLKRGRFMASGLILGLTLGLLFMIGKRSWHTYKLCNQD
jgi:capsular polysaccharide biosynthesis protein